MLTLSKMYLGYCSRESDLFTARFLKYYHRQPGGYYFTREWPVSVEGPAFPRNRIRCIR